MVHGRECPIKYSDVHTAGNTCTDHSNFGKCDRMAGQHSKYFFIWAALMRQLKIKIIIAENVKQFGNDPYVDELGEMYVCIRTVVPLA